MTKTHRQLPCVKIRWWVESVTHLKISFKAIDTCTHTFSDSKQRNQNHDNSTVCNLYTGMNINENKK